MLHKSTPLYIGFSASLSAAGLCLSSQALPAAGFIDMHCHTAGIGAGESGCFISEKLRKSVKFQIYLKSFDVSLSEVEEQGDSMMVDHISQRLSQSKQVGSAVLLALDGVVDAKGGLDRAATEVYIPNEFIAEQVSKHSNLFFGASVNPCRKDALERLEWAKAHGAVLVKWLPSIQHIDPSDPRLIPFYRKLVELGLPLLSHTGPEHAFSRADDRYSEPALLRLPCSLGVTVIAAHATSPKILGGMMKEYPNLYADISSLTQINKYPCLVELLSHPDMQNRLLYGSDYPLIAIPAVVSPWYLVFRLGFVRAWRIARIQNPWDRDVALKQALGLPVEMGTRVSEVLRVPLKS